MAKDMRGAHKLYVLTSVMGASGHGKTSLLHQYVEDAAAQGGRVLIIDHKRQWPQYHREKPGEFSAWPPKFEPGAPLAVWPGIHELDDYIAALIADPHYQDMLLVLDDADLYLHASARSAWRELFSSYRHLGKDIVVNSRRPQEIPKIFFASVDFFALFKQKDPLALAQIQRMVDADLGTELPDKPFQYLLIDMNSDKPGKIYRTKKMPQSDELAANQKGAG